MSTEAQPLRLVPFTRKVLPTGRWLIEPGDSAGIELPPTYHALFELIERGTTFAKLIDVVPYSQNQARFQFLKKFLLFLDDHDLLADRDYRRLADSLRSKYTWPDSVLTTPVVQLALASGGRRSTWSIVKVIVSLLTLVASIASVFLVTQTLNFDDKPDSLLRGLALFILAISVTRITHACIVWIIGKAFGSVPDLTLVIEPLAVRLRSEQAGRPLSTFGLVMSVVSLLTIFGAGWALSLAARTQLEFNLVLLGASVAFFTESSPYSRSFITDMLRSLYARLEVKARISGVREAVMRRAHVAACVTWIMMLGGFLVIDAGPNLLAVFTATHGRHGAEKISGYVTIVIFALFVLGWFVDVIGSISYDDATSGQIRRLWKRQSETALEKVQGVSPSASDLEKLPFLRQIPEPVRKTLLLAAQVRSMREGQPICRQGDADRHLFIVLEGKFAVAKQNVASGGRTRRKIVAWLEPGAVFGENAFFFGQPRTADVIAMEPSRVLVVPHTKDMKVIEADKSGDLQVRVWFLQALVQNQLFKDLPSESLDAILLSGVEQRFASGQKVIQEGEAADACYFMVQGRASVTQKTVPLAKLNAGDAFGEISVLFPGTLRTATIIADTDLLTIKIDRDRFWKLLRNHLPLALEIERLGLRRLRDDRSRDHR